MTALEFNKAIVKFFTGRENVTISDLHWENRHKFLVRVSMFFLKLWDKDHFVPYELDPNHHNLLSEGTEND